MLFHCKLISVIGWILRSKRNWQTKHILPPRAVQNSVRKGPPYKTTGSSQVTTNMCSSRRISSFITSLLIAMRVTAAPSLGSLTICIYKSLRNGLGLIVVFLVPHPQTRGVHEILISPIGVVDRVEWWCLWWCLCCRSGSSFAPGSCGGFSSSATAFSNSLGCHVSFCL